MKRVLGTVLILLGTAGLSPAQLTTRMEPTVVVEAKLLAKSDTPPMSKIFVYKEGLAVYEYGVVKAVQGNPGAVAAPAAACPSPGPVGTTGDEMDTTFTLIVSPTVWQREVSAHGGHERVRSDGVDGPSRAG